MKIALGADHAGFDTKQKLLKQLAAEGYEVSDYGTDSDEASDYPDYANKVAEAVASGKVDRGVLACGSGLGMCIAANKVKGVRAVTPWNMEVAKLAAQHNWANVICVPSRFVAEAEIKNIVLAWLATPFETGGRHERRVKKIGKIEANL